MGRLNLRLSDKLEGDVSRAFKDRGFPSASAFARFAIENELRQDSTKLEQTEQRIAGTLDRFAREVKQLHNGQQTLYALVDSLARVFFQCIPEPPADSLDQARAKARARYDNFVRNVARQVTNGAQRL